MDLRSRKSNQVTEESEKEKPKIRPRKSQDTDFQQQRLPAWQPILTAKTVLPLFFIIGVTFVPIGALLLWSSNNVREVTIDYTNCLNDKGEKCSTLVEDNPTSSNSSSTSSLCTCDARNLRFVLTEDWHAPVYMYYALTQFYQNHRRYVKSRDDTQLLGKISDDVSSDCDPFDKDEQGRKYIPCGAIANSLFSDTITLKHVGIDGVERDVPLLRTGIAWDSDRNYKFRNPPLKDNETLKDVIEAANGVKPRDWHLNLWELDPSNPDNNGLQNEDLIIWMRAAALPNFRKLYRRISHEGVYADGLPKGSYSIHVQYRFRVTQFSGTKSVVLSTTSWMGGKNPFLGYSYIVVGFICLILGCVFIFINRKYRKEFIDLSNLTASTSYD